MTSIVVFLNLVLTFLLWARIFWESPAILIAPLVGLVAAIATQNFITRKVVNLLGIGFHGEPYYEIRHPCGWAIPFAGMVAVMTAETLYLLCP